MRCDLLSFSFLICEQKDISEVRRRKFSTWRAEICKFFYSNPEGWIGHEWAVKMTSVKRVSTLSIHLGLPLVGFQGSIKNSLEA